MWNKNMNVDGLFTKVAADARGKAESPTVGSTEWNQWLAWTNEELYSFGEVHDWPELRNQTYPVYVGASQTSMALPENFKKFAGNLVIDGDFYTEVDQDLFDKYGNSEQVFRHGWDGGWFVEWKGQGGSAASGIVPISIYPTSLATATDNINMRNPMYLVKRLKVRIFKYRQNPIFSELETEADTMLQQMIENEYYKHSQYKGGATSREEEAGFVLGLD